MLKLALSQLRDQPRRYISVLLAIIVGVTFLASALMVGSSSNASLRNSLGSTYSTSDLVVAASDSAEDPWETGQRMTAAAGTASSPGLLSDVDGVQEAFAPVSTYVGLQRPGSLEGRGTASESADFAAVTTLPQNPELVPEQLLEGELPAADSATEIALDQATAQKHGLTVGDTTFLLAGSPDDTESGIRVSVSALLEPSQDPMLAGSSQIRAADPLIRQIETVSRGGSETGEDTEEISYQPVAEYVLIAVEDGADPAAVMTRVQSALDREGIAATVKTPDEQVQARVAQMAGSNIFVYVLAAFAAIALLVTALVISNTFSVLVAQRSRDLALQRALGASRNQIRGSVLVEAAVIGVVGSLIGFALAAGIVAGLIAIGSALPGFSFLTFGIDPGTVLISVGVGVLLTVLASLAPAALATRVSPLEAMRPREDAALGNRAGVVRLVVGGLTLLAGAAALVWGSFTGNILVAVAGGAVSFLGVLMLAVLFVPAAVKVAGVAARPAGVPGVMARLNAVRNPGRTASTAAALLIGTTLVAMMLTGGRTAQHQMDTMMANEYPVDLQVTLVDEQYETQSLVQAEQARERVAAVPDVADAALLSPAGTTENGTTVLAADPAQLRAVVAGLDGDGMQRLGRPGTILVPAIVETDTLTVNGPSGSVELETVRSTSGGIAPVMTVEDAAQIGSTAERTADGAPHEVWVKTGEGLTLDSAQDITSQVTTAAETSQGNVSGSLTLRLLYTSIIDGMLLVVTALLAVSVLIALIGVANTLSLSAIERTRENSLLRALGLTRKGLRGMLALEAVLIAGVAAVLGCTLGTLYGWMGGQAVLGGIVGGTIWPTVPWWELGVIVLVSVGAGLLASVAPARRATRLSPVQGLATA
ncbi:ABC transporter permease [Micrococcus terreus]|uniref:Putative ABC transport system permease protein n=1 Tax=Micrococcus terreus TaxID=574650 RepID=A0A1I7MQ78_9MICC|nr:FtsX family ABC transporter permease [Micrococcus terreus]SFV24066.1 putative ABC transport system permease protein [Micrococcus terreus]